MSIDLTECRAKIDRAKEHRELLESVVAPILEGEAEGIMVSAKLDPESGEHVFRVAAMPEGWLIRVGVILGDVVHNLRSTLDYLFWALCCRYLGVAKTQRMHKSVQFPIEDTGQRLANKRKLFSEIPSPYWAPIEDAQPYKGPDPSKQSLRVLQGLSNRDKHQTLNPVLGRSRVFQWDTLFFLTHPVGMEHYPTKAVSRLEVGTEVMRVPYGPDVDPEVEVAGYMTPSVFLPEGNLRMMRGVDAMIACVAHVLDAVEMRSRRIR